MGAEHKDAVVTMVERKSGYAVMVKVTNKTSAVGNLQILAARVMTLTFDSGNEFAWHAYIDEELQSTANFAKQFAGWERGNNKTLKGLQSQYVQKNTSNV